MEKNKNMPDKATEDMIKRMIRTLFDDGIAALSDTVIYENICLGCPGHFKKIDRAIDKKTADYLINNFSYILLGFISNDVFRDSFKDAVAVEIELENKTPDFIESIRKDMTEGCEPDNGPKYAIDFSVYNGAVAEKFSKLIAESIDGIMDFQDDFNQLVDEMTEESTITVGFCVSNFMYMIRAFDKNLVFRHYVMHVIDVVKKELS